MSLLLEYEERTSWKYKPITGRFDTHPGLQMKIDEAGGFRPFPGSTVVFKLDRPVMMVFQRARDILHENIGDMLAVPLPDTTFHVTLHDLVSPEQSRVSQVFVDDSREKHTLEYRWEVERSLEQARGIVEEIRRNHAGRRIALLADRVVNMVSKSLVLMLKPASEGDYELLSELYRQFDCVRELPYPLTPHVTLAYFKPGEIDGDRLNEAIQAIQVDKSDPMEVKLSIDGLTSQRFADMGYYEDDPMRVCFCCDGGMNRSVMAAAVLNHQARKRSMPVQAEARAAFRNTEGKPVPPAIIETLARHGIPTEAVPLKARYLEREDYEAFSRFIAMTGGAWTRCREIGIREDALEMDDGLFQSIADPQYGAGCDDVFEEISARVIRFLDDLAAQA